jgi:polysaccharide export outer membrane protein
MGKCAMVILAVACWLPVLAAETVDRPRPKVLIERPFVADTAYVLGPEDEVSVHVADLEEITDKPVRIDPNGMISLPIVGKLQAGGLTPDQLQAAITQALRKTMKNPEVAVNVVGFHSQPVTVLGAVNQPGVHQLQGPKRLLEVISEAGGTRPEAGNRVTITRDAKWGPLPLPTEQADTTGGFTTAQINLTNLTDGKSPEQNIYVRPHDLITVSRADLVYVIGEVKKSGGFTLGDHENMSVLQALALAEGLEKTAAPKSAKVLRKDAETSERKEIPVNLKRIIDGQEVDMEMMPGDILMVPSNLARSITIRTAEAAVEIATGLVIFRR